MKNESGGTITQRREKGNYNLLLATAASIMNCTRTPMSMGLTNAPIKIILLKDQPDVPEPNQGNRE